MCTGAGAGSCSTKLRRRFGRRQGSGEGSEEGSRDFFPSGLADEAQRLGPEGQDIFQEKDDENIT